MTGGEGCIPRLRLVHSLRGGGGMRGLACRVSCEGNLWGHWIEWSMRMIGKGDFLEQ